MSYRRWLRTLTFIAVTATSCSVLGQSSDTDTPSDRSSYLWNYKGEGYGFFELGGMSFSDSVRTQR